MNLFLSNLKKSNLGINTEHIEDILNNSTNNQSIIDIENKTYIWEADTITFLKNCKMQAFGDGYYIYVDKYNIEAHFGCRIHNIKFNEDYSEFVSTRNDDSYIVNGLLIKN
jgi:hypothetical protein